MARDTPSPGAGRGRGRIKPGLRPVDEQTRIDITRGLEQFQQGDATEHVFPPGLSNHDRAVIHDQCRKYGFTSKSHGKDERRRIHVYKPRASAARGHAMQLSLDPASAAALDAHFSRFPPTPAELRSAADGGAEAYSPQAAGKATQSRGRAAPAAPTAAELPPAVVAAKQAAWQRQQARADVRTLAAARAKLPISNFRDEILAAVGQHQVVLIAGETGCGKTTQVPQMLLEEAWGAGRGARIMCTQPRRISAVSVAERIAQERGEQIGDNIGYTIRLDTKGGPQSSLMFCTNGVLLRMLTQGDGLQGVTHVLVDEIHERDRYADFLLIMLRELLPKQPRLRLVLMSATLHEDLFSGYFGGCPIVRVPGFTHPVEDLFLEDVLRIVGAPNASGSSQNGQAPHSGKSSVRQQVDPQERAAVEEAIMSAFVNNSEEAWDALLEATGAASYDDARANAPAIHVQHSQTGATALMAAAGRGRDAEASALLANGADVCLSSHDGSTAAGWAARFGHEQLAAALADAEVAAAQAAEAVDTSASLSAYMADNDADEVDLELIEALLQAICCEGRFAGASAAGKGTPPDVQGAVLVFLPGWDDIMRLKDRLEASLPASRYLLLPLHSMVPAAEQRRVFVRPPAGIRKIVLATNIAETAITIDDVVTVINSGRLKEKSFDPYTAVSTLQSTWISAASEKQRRGRAGRCQPGVAFHLYSRSRAAQLAPFQLPELHRTNLDELCLQVKLLEGGTQAGGISAFLGKAVEPPADAVVRHAVSSLQLIGALTSAPGSEALTRLGRHLAALPLPPAAGKLLLYGVLFRCLDPLLTIACSLAYRDPWVLPTEAGARRAAAAARARLAAAAGGGSDHLALAAAHRGWTAARQSHQERAYCAANFLSAGTLSMIDGMRQQLLGELTGRRLVRSLGDASSAARDVGLVRCVLACGTYPLWARAPQERAPADARSRFATLITAKNERVRIHGSSINGGASTPGGPAAPAFVFQELTRQETHLYVHACTAVPPHFLPLVATRLQLPPPGDGDASSSDAEAGELQPALLVDDWLKLRVPQGRPSQLAVLRCRLAAAFAFKVERPTVALPAPLTDALQSIQTMLAVEGRLCSTTRPPPRSQRDPQTVQQQQFVRQQFGAFGQAPAPQNFQPPLASLPRQQYGGGRHGGRGRAPPQRGPGRGGRGRPPSQPLYQQPHHLQQPAQTSSPQGAGIGARGSGRGRGAGRGGAGRGRGGRL